MIIEWGGWGSNPQPADYESAQSYPRSSSVFPALPLLPGQPVRSRLGGDVRGRPVHGTSVSHRVPIWVAVMTGADKAIRWSTIAAVVVVAAVAPRRSATSTRSMSSVGTAGRG